MHEALVAGDPNLVHSLNAFLSSAQSVIWQLTATFNKKAGYPKWQQSRTERLPPEARIFKELRNVSVKEEPVENASVVIGWRLGEGTSEPALGPHETFTSPLIDTATGATKGKATVTAVDGSTREVDALELHDFGVEVLSDKKTYAIPAVITAARTYLAALEHEIAECERQFS